MVFFICYTIISVSLFVCTAECLPVETRSVCCNLYILYDGLHFTFQVWLLRRAISLNVQEPFGPLNLDHSWKDALNHYW